MNYLEDDEDYEEEIDDFDLISHLKTNIKKYNSNKLCEIVVCNRYLGFHAEASILAMEELAKRRIDGDNFDFENKIDSLLKELPVIDFSGLPDFRQILNQVIGKNNE